MAARVARGRSLLRSAGFQLRAARSDFQSYRAELPSRVPRRVRVRGPVEPGIPRRAEPPDVDVRRSGAMGVRVTLDATGGRDVSCASGHDECPADGTGARRPPRKFAGVYLRFADAH